MANATARRLRKTMTTQEVPLWSRLRSLRRQGYHFRRQAPLGGAIVDFACLRSHLVVEVDGGQHGMAGHARLDADRDARLRARGFQVLRFWNSEIDDDVDAVVATILHVLRR